MSTSGIEAVVTAARTFVALEADAVAGVVDQLDETFVRVASLLLDTAGMVVLTGAGTSGFMARRSAHLFSVSGTPAYFLNPTDGLHGSMGALRPGDVMIALSRGGSSGEVNEFAARVRREGVTVIALTNTADSPLGNLADIAVVLHGFPGSDPGNLIAMGSTLAHAAWLDALALVLMRARQYPWEKVHYTHPGGAVGAMTVLPDPLEPLEVPFAGLNETAPR